MPAKTKKDQGAAVVEKPAQQTTGDPEIDAMFAGMDATPPTENGEQGKDASEASDPPASTPADADTPDGEITSEASAELAKLAAKNGNDGGGKVESFEERKAKLDAAAGRKPKGKGRAASAPTAPSTTEVGTAAADATGPASTADGIPTDVPGLTSPGTSTRAGRKAKGKRAKGRKADPEKAKEKAAERKAKDKAKSEERKRLEKERKAKIEKDRKERAALRASKATPAILKDEPKQVQDVFAAHYKLASEVNGKGQPLKRDAKGKIAEGQTAMRRPKCDRGDFAAGWYILLLEMKKEGRQLPSIPKAAAKAS